MRDAAPTRAEIRSPAAGAAGDPAGFESWVVGSMSSGVLGIDASGAVASMNRAARRILGCPLEASEPVIGRACREVLSARPELVRLLLDALRSPHGLSRAELSLRGSAACPPLTIGFTLSPVCEPSGRPAGAAMIFRDLAPIERGDERERLRDRLAALGQMAAGLAHEIRNPLASLEVTVGLLRRRLAGRPEALVLLDEMLADLRGLAATVTASLDHVRPVAPERAPVAAVPLVEQALATALARVPFDGRVDRDYEPGVPELIGDADQLRAAVAELIVNALEAMQGRAGAMRLGLGVRALPSDGSGGEGARPPEVALLVSDTGPGVPAELREKVFYPFFTTKPRGSGLGLPSAQKIAAAHGGGLEIESRPGACRLRMRLPAEEPA
jgi:nitrogen-specific signal transduction histidine kinase